MESTAPGDPEVADLQLTAIQDKQDGRFEITMDHVTSMRGPECLSCLDSWQDSRIDGQATNLSVPLPASWPDPGRAATP